LPSDSHHGERQDAGDIDAAFTAKLAVFWTKIRGGHGADMEQPLRLQIVLSGCGYLEVGETGFERTVKSVVN
jgi:hypothetical protein